MATVELVIEFGNANCSIYRKDAGLVLKESSCIAFSKHGKRLLVKESGNKAKQMQGKTAGSIWVETPISDGIIVNPELAELLLETFIDKVVKRNVFGPCIKAILITSCALTSEEKRAFEVVAMKAGISYIWFVPSVITSLIGANANIKENKAKMIVNIGAGNTEIAAVSNNTIIDGYSIEMGGNVINSAICKTVFEEQGIVISDSVAEKIKIEIGSLFERDNAVIEITGVDALTKSARTGTVYAKDFYPVIAIAYKKITDAIEIFLNQQSADVCSDIATDGIYVCGGASKITGLESFIKNNLMLNVNIIEDAENVSILGGGKLLNLPNELNQIVENN